MHPRLAAKMGIADGDWTTAETRRGTITLKAQVVTTIRPDTIFIPYHWAGPKSVNQLTVAAQDPISKIPQDKVCGCRVRKADSPPDYAATCSSRSISGLYQLEEYRSQRASTAISRPRQRSGR